VRPLAGELLNGLRVSLGSFPFASALATKSDRIARQQHPMSLGAAARNLADELSAAVTVP
jgi:hypothetical protein